MLTIHAIKGIGPPTKIGGPHITYSMIYIQSNSRDISTQDVIRWILTRTSYRNIRVLTGITLVNDFSFELSNSDSSLQVNDIKINPRDTFWYRRGVFSIHSDQSIFSGQTYLNNHSVMISLLQDRDFNSHAIGRYSDNNLSKIKVLSMCREIGIAIPETLVTTCGTKLDNFIHKDNTSVITKSIKNPSEHLNFLSQTYEVSTGTMRVDRSKKYSNEVFAPSLFQKEIEKLVELRIFYLYGEFYPMAIYSQQNAKTEVDYRNYDRENPNRLSPFVIRPKYLEKLTVLMHKLGLESGSIDVILNRNENYIFLEVNPVGQFQWLSKNCNYNIEKQIALILTREY